MRGIGRVLAFPLEKVLMPYWMELTMNRCAVCGHCDPGSTNCMATHPIEVRGHQPPVRPKMKGQTHCSSRPWTGREGGGAAEPPQDYSFRV